MKKKPYKIVKSKLFREQEKKLPKEVKDELQKVLKKIAKNPVKVKNSMDLCSLPNAKELRNWMSGTKVETIDLALEYLHDKDCLNKKGIKLAHNFWERYIKKI